MWSALLAPRPASPPVPRGAAAPPSTTAPDEQFVEPAGNALSETIRDVMDNLGNNGYQTGTALIVSTVAVVAMINLKINKWAMIPTAVGAFWAGWLGWNTIAVDNNPLFPGEVSATKLWDVAFTSDRGFLLVVGVACAVAVLLWRKGVARAGRLVVLVGAVLGASFVYNLVEAVRVA